MSRTIFIFVFAENVYCEKYSYLFINYSLHSATDLGVPIKHFTKQDWVTGPKYMGNKPLRLTVPYSRFGLVTEVSVINRVGNH